MSERLSELQIGPPSSQKGRTEKEKEGRRTEAIKATPLNSNSNEEANETICSERASD